MKGLLIALEKFMAGACKEGYKQVMKVKDLEKSWQTSVRADWMLWLLRRQASVTDVEEPARSLIREFQKFAEDVYEVVPEPQRAELMEKHANGLRAMMPNPFNAAGYAWLHRGLQNNIWQTTHETKKPVKR